MEGSIKPKVASRSAGLDNPVMRTFQSVLAQPRTISNRTPATIAEGLSRLAAAVAEAQPEAAATAAR